jgi:hypothetical protein
MCRVCWSGDVSGARPRHVRVRVVSRFSALQKTCKNTSIEMHSKHTPSITLSVILILWCNFLHSLYMSVKNIYTHRMSVNGECK